MIHRTVKPAALLSLLSLPALLSPAAAAPPVREEIREAPLFDDLYARDLAAGFAEARRTGKPLLVVLRCVP